MPIEPGSFVLVEYSLYDKATGRLIETTSKEEAEKHGIKPRPSPYLVILGEKRVIEGFEETLQSMNEGEEKEVEIPPEKAYGRHDPNKVRVIPLRELLKHGIEPKPGMTVEIGGKLATIISVTGGRVQVDFNHPLAGKTLILKLKVVKVLREDKEKILHLVLRHIPLEEGEKKIQVELSDNNVKIKLPEEVYLAEGLQYAKAAIVADIFKYFGQISSVTFIEEYVRKTQTQSQ